MRGNDDATAQKERSGSALSRMIQHENLAIHKRLGGVAPNDEVVLLRKDIEEGYRATTATLKAIHEEIKDLRGMDAEITAFRMRMTRVERKMRLAKIER